MLYKNACVLRVHLILVIIIVSFFFRKDLWRWKKNIVWLKILPPLQTKLFIFYFIAWNMHIVEFNFCNMKPAFKRRLIKNIYLKDYDNNAYEYCSV